MNFLNINRGFLAMLPKEPKKEEVPKGKEFKIRFFNRDIIITFQKRIKD